MGLEVAILRHNMEYKNPEVRKVAQLLKKKFEQLDDKRAILRAAELSALYESIKGLPPGEARAGFGKEANKLKAELEQMVRGSQKTAEKTHRPIDVTAPFDVNVQPED